MLKVEWSPFDSLILVSGMTRGDIFGPSYGNKDVVVMKLDPIALAPISFSS